MHWPSVIISTSLLVMLPAAVIYMTALAFSVFRHGIISEVPVTWMLAFSQRIEIAPVRFVLYRSGLLGSRYLRIRVIDRAIKPIPALWARFEAWRGWVPSRGQERFYQVLLRVLLVAAGAALSGIVAFGVPAFFAAVALDAVNAQGSPGLLYGAALASSFIGAMLGAFIFLGPARDSEGSVSIRGLIHLCLRSSRAERYEIHEVAVGLAMNYWMSLVPIYYFVCVWPIFLDAALGTGFLSAGGDGSGSLAQLHHRHMPWFVILIVSMAALTMLRVHMSLRQRMIPMQVVAAIVDFLVYVKSNKGNRRGMLAPLDDPIGGYRAQLVRLSRRMSFYQKKLMRGPGKFHGPHPAVYMIAALSKELRNFSKSRISLNEGGESEVLDLVGQFAVYMANIPTLRPRSELFSRLRLFDAGGLPDESLLAPTSGGFAGLRQVVASTSDDLDRLAKAIRSSGVIALFLAGLVVLLLKQDYKILSDLLFKSP